jgi:hypothetical protein
MSHHHFVPSNSLQTVDETRSQAGRLLRQLLIDQRWNDERFAQTGRRDPLKSLTGFSALERAVATTREMIHRIDQVLVEMETDEPGAVACEAAGGRQRWPT